jgi:hypothetical protein
MTVDEIYRLVLDLYRKDHKGVVLPPSVFNNWLQFVSLDMFNGVLTQAEQLAAQGNINLSDVIFKMTILGNFIKDEPLLPVQGLVGTTTIGYASTPDDCKIPLGLLANGNIVELKSPVLKVKYRGSATNGDLGANPVGFYEQQKIEFLPNDLDGLLLTYLRRPSVPYYDFCISSNDLPVFMPVGSIVKTHVYGDAPELDPPPAVTPKSLYDNNGVLLQYDVTANGAYPYLSKTTELDWDETQHQKLANLVAEKLGINLRLQTGA